MTQAPAASPRPLDTDAGARLPASTSTALRPSMAPVASGVARETEPARGARQPDSDTIDPGTPDLAREAAGLGPPFPLEVPDSRLVLFGDGQGPLYVAWGLTRTEYERAAAIFPAAGPRPALVVRLTRGTGGEVEAVAEAAPAGPGGNGAGELAFEAASSSKPYRAELGLTSAGGGWLMLRRSNAHYQTPGVGVRLKAGVPARAEDRRPPAMPSQPVSGGDRNDAGPVSERGSVIPAPSVAIAPLPVSTALAPLPDGGFPLVSVAAAARPSPRVAQVCAAMCAPAVWMPQLPMPVETGVRGEATAAPELRDGRWSSTVAASPADPTLSAGALPPSVCFVAPVQILLGQMIDQRDAVDALTRQTPLERHGLPPGLAFATAAPGERLPAALVDRIAPQAYGAGPPPAERLEIAAELIISGRAAPNAELDLFGFRYRLGPGGRFQLELPVDDPELIARALAARPPAELIRRGR